MFHFAGRQEQGGIHLNKSGRWGGFGFTGKQNSSSTNLLYLRARYYSPYLNQFIQPDPVVPDPFHPTEWNKYLYGWDNPINIVDPSGKYPACVGEECYRYVFEDVLRLYGISMIGEWTAENKAAIISAIDLVALKFKRNIRGLDSSPSIFKAVYGIHVDRNMIFKWNLRCYQCRPDQCKGSKNDSETDYWDDKYNYGEDSNPLKINGKTQYEQIAMNGASYDSACKPKGGFTHGERSFEFASMWDGQIKYQELRKINNVIHELGHAFNVRTDGVAVSAVASYSAIINGDQWSLTDRTRGFYRELGDTMIY